MSRRIDIELTSALDDGSWTWRAAGARHPKGVVPGSVLPDGAKVGDEYKVEVEQEIDGITILGVVHGRAKPERADVIELLPAEREFQPVVETRAPGGRRRDDDRPRRARRDDEGRGDRRPRRDGAGRDGAGRDGAGRDGGRGDGERRPRREGGDRPRRGPSFTPPPEVPQRPKPQRLKPGKAHRSAVLADLPEEQRPIAELALQGLAAVRQKVRDENQKAAAEGRATMPEASVMKIAEELLPKLRVAEWRDRAEAAQRQMANLDLRDLRSVVAAANDPIVVRDESTRSLASELTEGLATRQEQELVLWFGDVDAALAVGRVVRALRLSSQPPKAGVPFPADIAQRLVDSANAALAPMDPPERWIAMLEAAAFSPVRSQIKPIRKPDAVSDELTATITRLAPALPQVAELFGVEVDPKAPMPKPLRPGPRPGSKDAKPDRGDRGDKPRGDRKPKGDAPRDKARKHAAPGTDGAPADTSAAIDAPDAAADTPGTAATPASTQPPDAPITPDAATDTPDAAATPQADEPQPATEHPTTTDTPELADTSEVAASPTPAEAENSDVTGTIAAPTADATTTSAVAESSLGTSPAGAETPVATDTTDAATSTADASADAQTPGGAETPAAPETPAATDTTDAEIFTADPSTGAQAPDGAETPEIAEPPAVAPEPSEAPPTDDAAAATDTSTAPAEQSADAALADLLDTAAGDQLIAEAKAVQPESAAVEAEAEALAAVEQAGDELDR